MKGQRRLFIAAGLLLFLACLLGFAAKGGGALPGDAAISRAIQRAVAYGPAIESALGQISALVRYLPIIAIVFVLLLMRWKEGALLAIAATPVVFFTETYLKLLFERPRPAAGLVNIYENARGFGFPSGTALRTMVVFGVVSYLARQAGRAEKASGRLRLLPAYSILFLFCLALLIIGNLARIYVGAHWASDIIGGWMFGVGWVLIVIAVYQWWLGRRPVTQ